MPAHDLSTAVRECVSCKRCYDSHVQFCPECLVELVNIELIPRLINSRYRLERVLGHGSLDTVFAATDLTSQQEVAVKVIRASAIADPRALDRFHREAQIAIRLSHPQIAAVYDQGMLPDASAYVAMELVRGDSLRDEMKRAGRFTPARAVPILLEIAGALDAAHKAGLVHRDLKPESVALIPAPGQDRPQIKLLDFGLARIASGQRVTDSPTAKLKRRPQPLGAPAYMSPEQFRGEEVDLRSDIYSLGVIAYEMLAGRPPFSAKSVKEWGLKHLTEKARPLPPLNPEVNALLDAAIRKALEKEPLRRHQRAVEFKRELLSAAQIG
jgi:serine/threonine-protein kinase